MCLNRRQLPIIRLQQTVRSKVSHCLFSNSFFIYSSTQKFFKLPFDENNFDSVFGANQKINIEKKIRLTPTIIPTSPSDERISNTPIMLYLMRVGKMKPKTRNKQYKVVNILYILKTDFIAYLILCSESLHCNRVFLPHPIFNIY